MVDYGAVDQGVGPLLRRGSCLHEPLRVEGPAKGDRLPFDEVLNRIVARRPLGSEKVETDEKNHWLLPFLN